MFVQALLPRESFEPTDVTSNERDPVAKWQRDGILLAIVRNSMKVQTLVSQALPILADESPPARRSTFVDVLDGFGTS